MRIGPAGNSLQFYDEGHKATTEMPLWLSNMGLNAYEYSFGRGIRMSHETAKNICDQAKKYDILISGHAPYFINLANIDGGMLEKSYTYVTSTAEMTRSMGGNRVIFHPATVGKLERGVAVDNMVEKAKVLVDKIYDRGYSDMTFCPETMGKMGQIGDTTEILKICKLWENFIPCIDFGHLNCRMQGGIKTTENYCDIIDEILQTIGERGRNFHVHFSKIKYGKGGEVCHLTFEDTEYGPEFYPLAEAIYKMNVEPTIICESAGTQAKDALLIKNMLNTAKKQVKTPLGF